MFCTTTDAVKQRQDKVNQGNFNLEKAINKQLSIDAPTFIEKSTRLIRQRAVWLQRVNKTAYSVKMDL